MYLFLLSLPKNRSGGFSGGCLEKIGEKRRVRYYDAAKISHISRSLKFKNNFQRFFQKLAGRRQSISAISLADCGKNLFSRALVPQARKNLHGRAWKKSVWLGTNRPSSWHYMLKTWRDAFSTNPQRYSWKKYFSEFYFSGKRISAINVSKKFLSSASEWVLNRGASRSAVRLALGFIRASAAPIPAEFSATSTGTFRISSGNIPMRKAFL